MSHNDVDVDSEQSAEISTYDEGTSSSTVESISTYVDLGRAFARGMTGVSHRKLEVRDDGERTLLVAYDQWVYATREKESGIIEVDERWTDKDRATTASNIQMGYVKRGIKQEIGLAYLFTMQRNHGPLRSVDGEEYDSFTVDAVPA